MPLVAEYIQKLEPYRPGKPIDDVRREYGLEKIIKLASNENPLGVSPLAIQAMIGSIHQINRYPDIASLLLRSKLAEMFNVGYDSIVTGHGSEAIMQTAVRTFLMNGEEVITAEGTFVGFYIMVKACGIKMQLIPLKDYRYNLKAIAGAITPKTKMIYLVNPNSPTGTIYTKSEFEEFMKCIPPNVLVIVDEAYIEFVKDHPDFPDSMDYRYDNVITLRTFSKAYGLAGIRIGYGFAHPELISQMHKVRLPFEPGIPSQAAGVAALMDKQFLDYYLKLNNCGKEFLYDSYNKLGIEYVKTEANFIMSVFDSEKRVNDITDKLLRKGVIVRGLKPFLLPNCIRVTIGLPEENQIYIDTLKLIL
ncbi:MAG: histidinol-phosphate transaminase [Ignavibacteriae bacterium]|nr:histidinol-phosphate transaminase [Ignavibacteriota bacterium]